MCRVLFGSLNRLLFESSNHPTSFLVVVFHSDVWINPIMTNVCFKYVILFFNNYSRYAFFFLCDISLKFLLIFIRCVNLLRNFVVQMFVIFNIIGVLSMSIIS